MNFGDALEKLKSGYHIRRKEWKNIDYLCLGESHKKTTGGTETIDSVTYNSLALPDGTETIIAMMKWDDPSFRVWMPGQRELLAEDWELALKADCTVKSVTPTKVKLFITFDNKDIYSADELRRALYGAIDKSITNLEKEIRNIG